MENWFLLYLLTRIDSLRFLLEGVTFLGLFTLILGLTPFFIAGKNDRQQPWFIAFVQWHRLGRIIWCIAALLYIAIPTKNDVFFIVGGSAIIDAVKSDRAARIGTKSLDAVERWLDENMSDRPNPKETGNGR